ncbi:MAG: PatA/PatG family cyanobactin maturation protease [Microcystis aeruginosa Ma_QC_Ca_00000000_S207]|uniref:PatA/PatG family cyanobactin maturation protease n=1 Tax=Microcystis aeruginosa Ma_QC_Ca_00000000_S207 TaxID=2486251 RepID=A0A552FI68_MICAE|nr:MAG: PatA/PatG family cyanobactin maturation protease [Microcystis aeruginosa Ma_QC_Ca_00000000_S207]
MPNLSGIESLWLKTLGDPRICVAVLDGDVDQSHPCFHQARLTQIPTLISAVANQGFATQHGTHVTSIIFGQHDSSIQGIAPNCRGLIVPIFGDGQGDKLAPCSQIDLARAITQAVEQGANIINVSGGQLTASPESDQLLANAVRLCQERNVLIVAAAGNDGCECLHLPAALESVLAVGAMDSQGKPLNFSNWGKVYQNQGILAPGDNILGAALNGGTILRSGTSFATPIVSGIIALLLSIQLQRGEKPDPYGARQAILKSALPCHQDHPIDSRRCLAGTLNISGAYTLITQGGIQPMSNQTQEQPMMQTSEVNSTSQEPNNAINEIAPFQSVESSNSTAQLAILPSALETEGLQAKTAPIVSINPSNLNSMSFTPNNEVNSSIAPSACACSGNGNGAPQIVYAIGQLGTDFGTEARRDSFTQAMPPNMSLLEYLNQNPYEAQSLIWTLSLDATPIYAIVPVGAYASVTYDRLRAYLGDENIERISVPGVISGSIRLLSGQVVPVIIPEVRGMYSWSVPALVQSVMPQLTATDMTEDDLRSQIEDYLNRIYYDYRNLGITPQERALNFSATNAFQASVAIASAAGSQRVLDSISVEKSPICRPDSDCYDVKLSFFDPENNQRSNRVFRFTIDVSDIIPVTIGQVRSWSQS